MSLPEWELWACALYVEREHGVAARAHVAGRIEALQRQGDAEGVETWKAIAAILARISAPHRTVN